MTVDRGHVCLAVELALGPDRTAVALDEFTAANPHQDGIRWADVLDQLLDVDAHLDVTEALEPTPGIDWSYQAAAALSLYYARGRLRPGPLRVRDLARDAQALTPDQVLAWVQQGGWSR